MSTIARPRNSWISWGHNSFSLLHDELCRQYQQRQAQTSVSALSLLEAAGLAPDPVQARVVTTPGDQLLLCHRQWGKSTIVASMALEDACRAPDGLVLLVSRSMRQSGELFRKVKQFYNLTQPLPLLQDSALSLELSNRSRIVSLPGSEETIVGYSSVRRLILDEAARIADPVYYAVRPMLAMSGGSIICLSTAYGRQGFFYDAWTGEADEAAALDQATVEAVLADLGMVVQPDTTPVSDARTYQWTKTMVTAPENPRLSPRFLAHERRSIPDLWFRQEWLCEFLETGEQVFRYEDLEAMIADDVQPLFGGQVDAYAPLRGDVQPLVAGNGAVWQP